MEMLRAIDVLCRMFGLYNQPTSNQNGSYSNNITLLSLQEMDDKELHGLISTPR
jgi:hypothetical protein